MDSNQVIYANTLEEFTQVIAELVRQGITFRAETGNKGFVIYCTGGF